MKIHRKQLQHEKLFENNKPVFNKINKNQIELEIIYKIMCEIKRNLNEYYIGVIKQLRNLSPF